MNTTELTSTEINRLVANAAGYFVDEEGDLCYLYTQEQRDAATTAEERLVNLIASAAIDIAAIDVRAIQSTLGVSRVPADFDRTIGRKLDSIEEQTQELAAKPVHLAALTIAAELVDIPDAHRGGIYAFNAWTGEGGEWYSAGTVLPAGAVGVPARQHDWSDYDGDEALEAINQLHDLEGLIAQARSAADD